MKGKNNTKAKENDIDIKTRFEKAKIIGSRALQISMGSPLYVKLSKKKLEEIRYNPIEIAKIEYEKGVIPLKIKRPLPKKEE